VAQVLQLAHLVEHHRVAQVDVGRGRVQPQLDAQRLAGGSARCSLACQSAWGSSSSAPRRLTAMPGTASEIGALVTFVSEFIGNGL
jgi:hypothetical protein